MKESVIVIGGGVAGLAAAAYARASGFDTTLIEHAPALGGVCTAWQRGPYLIDGCIHWLTGGPFAKLYEELCLTDGVRLEPIRKLVTIIDHATKKLGIPEEKVVINVDRYGNTSSGSIPLALADAAADGRLKPGALVLMTGMGAGLTWGSALIEWTQEVAAA